MDLGALRDSTLTRNLSFQGVLVTITPPFEEAFTSTGIWRPSRDEDFPEGDDANRLSPRRSMALPRAAVGSLPLGSIIFAPEKPGGTARDWKVDAYEELEDNTLSVKVVPVTL